MYLGKKVLLIIPARGGSKGVPFKNIFPLGGKPLIEWTLDSAKKLGTKVRVHVSTDSEKIKGVVEKYGFNVPFLRPKFLSGDKAKDFGVIEHSLKKIEKLDNTKYDIILMLQPTSPFRNNKVLLDILRLIIKKKYDSIWTVSKIDLKYHAIKQLVIKNQMLKYFSPKGNLIPIRQDLDNTYNVNGYAYAFSRNCIIEQKSRLGLRTFPYIIKEKTFNIDTKVDFIKAENFINKIKIEK